MDKKIQIMQTAMTLFVEQGFEHTPTSQISKESGVATGTLFYYFKSKEELINAVYIFVKKSMSDSLFSKFDDSKELKSQMQHLWVEMLRWGFKHKLENQFLTRFYGSTYISKLAYDESLNDFKIAEDVFKLATDKKLIKKMSNELHYNLFMSLQQSFLQEAIRLKKLDNSFLDESFEMYFNCIKE